MNARNLFARNSFSHSVDGRGRTGGKRRSGRFVRLLLAAFVAATTGCVAGAPQPHITAKVIYQHDDVAAELSTEWAR